MELETLINEYWRVFTITSALEKIANNPQCGKPGHGFKAARKARKALVSWQPMLTEHRTRLDRWITRNNKASKDERASRLARVKAVLPEY